MVSEADTVVVAQNNVPGKTETTRTKYGRADVRGRTGPGPDIRLEPRSPTSHSGFIVFGHLFPRPGTGERPWGRLRRPGADPAYGRHVVMMPLVVRPIIGHRRLRDTDSHRDGGMVGRIPGPKRLPDVSAVGRPPAGADGRSVAEVRSEPGHPVMERSAREGFSRVAPDCGGPASGTGRHAEGTAVGFNRKRKGVRSHYPLV